MVILDFVRKSRIEGAVHWIDIPSFHTGALGFMPGTEILAQARGVESSEGVDTECEMYITPFLNQESSMFRLGCLLEDGPGVVTRLLLAASSMEINIVKQESVIIEAGRQHYVSMVLDWTRSEKWKDPVRARRSDMHLYSYLKAKVPIDDYRYIVFYEEIMTRCGGVILLDPPVGNEFERRSPAIRMEPFYSRGSLPTDRGTVERHPTDKNTVQIKLSPGHVADICRLTHAKADEPIPYVLSSDGKRRALRAYFPKKSSVGRLVHIGLRHKDRSGALAAFGSRLQEEGCNIIASLLRKVERDWCIWELIVDCREAAKKMPSFSGAGGSPSQCAEDFARLLSGDYVGDDPYEFSVQLPLYPRPTTRATWPVRCNWKAVRDVGNERSLHVDEDCGSSDVDRQRRRLAVDVRKRLGRKKPRIFVSAPQVACEHAVILRAALVDIGFEVIQYNEQDFHGAAAQAVVMIRSCDYFAGIWHHEVREPGRYGLSPWLPFEYGAARAAGLPSIVVHSRLLPERITQRIEAGIAFPAYSDLEFEMRTVPRIVKYCREEWLASDEYPRCID